jgi:CrcB protein
MTAAVVAAALVAGALAALLRYGISVVATRRKASLPWAVLIVNVAGSLVAGVAIALADGLGDPGIRLILLTGFAGGLTTFGTLTVETVQLVVEGRWRVAAGSVAANLVAGIAAFLAGWGATGAVLSATGAVLSALAR